MATCRVGTGRDQIMQEHVKILHKLADASQRFVVIGTDEMHHHDWILFAHLFQTPLSARHTVFVVGRWVGERRCDVDELLGRE